MRISGDRSHPDYHPQAHRCRVFLEGVERNNVLFADEEGRFAVTERLDERGRPVIKAGEVLTDMFYGAVRIEVPDGFMPWIKRETSFACGGVVRGNYLVGERPEPALLPLVFGECVNVEPLQLVTPITSWIRP